MSEQFAPEGAAQPQSRGKAMAITALVIGIVSLMLCWVPIVNNVVFFLGLNGLAIAFVAHRRAKKGKAGGRGMAGAAIALSVLSLVGVIATQALYGAILDEVSDGIDEASTEVEDEIDGNSAKSASDRSAEKDADVHALGEQVEVGDYVVAVQMVNLDAADVIAAANQFNEPAKGRYVMATLAVTYQGPDEGTPWLDLGATLAGGDSRNYSTTTCSAVVPNAGIDQPSLSKGGTTTYNVCFDVPKKALGQATLYVEDTWSFDEQRGYWSVR